MSYLSSFSIKAQKSSTFPFNIPAVRYAQDIEFATPVTFFVGDNGTGKSTLLEALAHRMQLPHMDGAIYTKSGFEAARALTASIEMTWAIDRSVGFFFRAEDFGDYLNSVERTDASLGNNLNYLQGEVPEKVIQEMKDNANYQLHHMRKNYGQELQSFSHGEAYLKIMQEKINKRGIYLLDEPEAALSPSKQLSLIYFINEHLQSNTSQFIIVTHSPMLMAFPGATIYEINQDSMTNTPLEETEHFSVTKSFLNNPEAYLRHLE